MAYYYLKLDGAEEQWVTWSHWSSTDPEDDGFYVTSNKIRACIFSEEAMTDGMIKKQLERFGTYTMVPVEEQELRKYRSRIYRM